MRKPTGWLILILSCFLWTALIVVPFLSLPTSEKAYWAGGLFIAAEVSWYAGLLLLGPEAIGWIKAGWARLQKWLGK